MSEDWEEGPRLSDPQAERALLSAALWSRPARQTARAHITGADFYNPHHEALWDAMWALDRAGKNVDAVTLHAYVMAKTPKPLQQGVGQLLIDVTSHIGIPDSAGEYASIIRSWGIRRRLQAAGARLQQQAMDEATPPVTLASNAVRVLTQIRDHGAGDDVTALTLTELMAVPDQEPRWVIPDLLEEGDRLMLTGSEGAGKSALSRQLGIMAASGVHPFTNALMPPIRAVYVDCENKANQVRRQTAPLLRWLGDHDADDPTSRVLMDFPGRIDLARDKDLAAVHRLIDAAQPDLLVIGPMYRMSNRSLNDEETAAQFLVALDSIMDRGVALIIEAHAGHSSEGVDRRTARRALRPRGSSSLLGWPEFGLGLRALQHGIADLEPWRGGREQRAWPYRLRRTAGNRWTETHPDDRGDPEPIPPAEPTGGAYADHEDPQGALV